jgi:hypothetical protein
MTGIRVALIIIGVAYAVLGLVLVLFSVILRQRGDIGTAYFAVWVLAWGGTIAATALSAGSLLGTVALVRHPHTRRALYVLIILSGWIGALGLGWVAWQFWTHSALPKVAA